MLPRPHTGGMAESRDAVVVTTAGMSGSEDRRLRERRYLITQLVRVSCFVLAVLLPVPLWAKMLLIVGAFTLPWLGVVAANAGPTVQRHRPLPPVEPMPVTPVARLDPGRVIDQA